MRLRAFELGFSDGTNKQKQKINQLADYYDGYEIGARK
jgi:hypothetical protein